MDLFIYSASIKGNELVDSFPSDMIFLLLPSVSVVWILIFAKTSAGINFVLPIRDLIPSFFP